MKTLKKYIKIGILIGSLSILTGCGTMYAYQHNKSAAIEEYAYSTGDEEVITAYRNGDVQGIGVNITAIDTVFRSPGSVGVQLLGALVDAAAVYGISEAVDSYNDDSGDSSNTSAGRDATVINNTGNGNKVEINNSQGSTVTPPTL